VGPGLAEPGDADQHQLRIARLEVVEPEAEALEIAVAEALDHHVEMRDQIQDDARRLGRLEVERDALLVPRVYLPVHAHACLAPVAQRVAPARLLDLDDLGAEVGELKTHHVAGDEPREVEHADAAERPFEGGVEALLRKWHGITSRSGSTA